MLGILSKRKVKRVYPREFWLLFWGVFLNRVSFSMLWPFLTIFIYERLGVPLTTVMLLLSLRSLASLLSTGLVSPLMDKFGRKQAMVWGTLFSAIIFIGMSEANTLPAWVFLLVAHGLVLPVFNIGVNTMVADLVTEENRTTAYALIRTITNAGIAIGPLIGGVLVLRSTAIVFLVTAVFFIVIALLLQIYLVETKPKAKNEDKPEETGGGYGFMLRDKVFLRLLVSYLLVSMAYAHVWVALPVYMTEQFQLHESDYSLVVTVNAVMVVFFQYAITRFTSRFQPIFVLGIGSLVYTVGLLSIAFGTSTLHFVISMVIATLGELINNPTIVTYTANHAPTTMRARYMGAIEVLYPVASGVGPVLGGLLNDNVAPVAMWYGAGAMALLGAIALFGMTVQQDGR